jgi:3-phosphoshikimate 1-carboxyvinyltransferase
MGGDVTFLNRREEGGEPIADIRVCASDLVGISVPPERAPTMIDEYPVLSVVAAFAKGETHMHGLAELKVKESDRLAATAAGLEANGIRTSVTGDSLLVAGRKSSYGDPVGVPGGGTVETHLDHRMAMAFLVMGLASTSPVTVDDAGIIATSFPEFRSLMQGLGAQFAEPGPAR